ncbi:MAG: acetate--CoA ligase [bacterium]
MKKVMIKKGGVYFPSKEIKRNALVNKAKIYKEAAKNPLRFWEGLAKEVVWEKKWKKTFVHKPPYFQWFVGGKLNITETCLEKNMVQNRHKVALIWEPEPTEERERYLTYYDLYRSVNRLANALLKIGVKKGDRVGIYLPMIPETVISMLACARIGAVHVVVFSAFSANALRVRLEDTETKVLITADGYYRHGNIIPLKKNVDEAVLGTKIEKVIVVKRGGNEVGWQEGRDFWFSEIIANEKDFCPAQPMNSEDPFFILYTSGSTGKPKGIVHTCGGYAVQTSATGRLIFDLKSDDILWCTSDVGWITGHTYSIYSPLMNGVPTVLFEGVPNWPAPDRWAQVIEKYGITTFYTAPTAIRMFEKYGAELIKKYTFSTLQILGSVGEPIDEAAWLWYFNEVGRKKCPIVDTWWQTELGGILISSLPGIGPFKPMFTGIPFPGTKFEIIDDKGKKCSPGKKGNLVLLPPFAPGVLRGVYKNHEKYVSTYWSQYGEEVYFTSDAAYKDKTGLIRIVGRVDDVLKVAGHRLATGELENAVNLHPEITECATVGVPDAIKGEVPVIFAVYKGNKETAEVKKEIIDQIKKEIGPIALPKEIYLVADLPKTRSGKIMRRIFRKIFTGEELGDLSTLANPEVVEDLKKAIGN